MAKWDKFLSEDEEVPSFEKFDKTVKIARRSLKRGDDFEEKKQKEKERDEERNSKRGDEV